MVWWHRLQFQVLSRLREEDPKFKPDLASKGKEKRK